MVALVLAVLVALAARGLSSMRSKSSLTSCRGDVATLDAAAEVYWIQQSAEYPKSIPAFGALIKQPIQGVLSADGLSIEKSGYTVRYNPKLGTASGVLDDGAPCGT